MNKEYDAVADEINSLSKQLTQLREAAFFQYSSLVDRVLCDEITEIQNIEHIMDGLLDFCDDEKFIDIYKKLCRHIYSRYPRIVGEHIALFRAQFMDPDDE